MSIKAAPQAKTSSTPVPIQASVGLGQTRAFTDHHDETSELGDSTSNLQLAAAPPPPPEIQLNRATQFGYDFSRISVSNHIPATVQTKLVVGAPGDKYEQEADRMADKVMSMTVPVNSQPVQRQLEEEPEIQTKPLAATVQRQETDDEISLKPLAATVQRQETDDEEISLKPLTNKVSPVIQRQLERSPSNLISRKDNGAFTASQSVESRLKSQQGSGQPLPKATCDFMESRFGNDFSEVKIHTDNQAVQLSKELGAQAFTHGNDVYFNSGKYSPESDSGKRLLAHELTHTIQQTGPKIKAKSLNPLKPNIQRQGEALAAKPISTSILGQSNVQVAGRIQAEGENTKAKDRDSETEEEDKQKENTNGSTEAGGEAKVEGGGGNADASEAEANNSTGTESGAGTQGNADSGAGTADGTSGGGASASDASSTSDAALTGDVGAGNAGGGTTLEPITVPQNPGGEAPDSPEADPAFQAVVNQSQNVATQYAQHPAPEDKAKQAQQAAEDPQQQMRNAQAKKVEQTSQQETKPFDRASFEKALLEKLDSFKPKSLEDADNFSKNGKVGEIKEGVLKSVEAGKQESAGGLPAANQAKPNPETEQPKPVTSIPDVGQDIGNQQPTIEADKAVPKEKSDTEIEQPLAETAQNLDATFGQIQTKLVVGAPGDRYEQEADQMADRVMAMPELKTPDLSEGEQVETLQATSLPSENSQRSELVLQRKESLPPQSVEQPVKEVPLNTERLETWSEIGGSQALGALKEAKKHTTEGPQEYRQQEQTTLTTAEGEAVAMADKTNQEMFADRTDNLNQVAALQQGTKGEDEQKRSKVTQDVEKIYQETKTSVEARLKKLDEAVNQEFKQGSQAARRKFEGYARQKMDAYKKDRYSGLTGGLKWAKDKIFGMPSEVNQFYEEGKQLYINEMKKSISTIATVVETGLTEAKALVDRGRQQVNDYVASLPEDLKQVGAEAATNVQSQFNSLEQSVKDKQSQLLDSLTEKYQKNLQELDQRIEQLKDENKGLAEKALALVGEAAKWLLKQLLTPVKTILGALIGDTATKVIDAIIDDPIGFMKKLFKGIGDGIGKFVTNIRKHLINGLTSWLFGNIGEIKLPEEFNLKGFLDILLQILGLSKDYIFGLAEAALGTDVVEIIKLFLEKGQDALSEEAQEVIDGLSGGAQLIFNFFKSLITEGPIGIWKFIQESLDSLKAMFMEELMLMVTVEIVKAGVIWLISLLNPASAVVKAVKMIIDVISFIIEKAAAIKAFIDAVVGTLTAIIEGNVSAMATAIEEALGMALPVALGFFASLIGLGGITSKIQKIFKKLRAPVDKTIGKVFEKMGSITGGKGKGKKGKKGNGKVKKKGKGKIKGKSNVKTESKEITKEDKNKKNKEGANQKITNKKGKAATKETKGTEKKVGNSKDKKKSRNNKSKFDLSELESQFDEFSDLVGATAPQEDEETDSQQDEEGDSTSASLLDTIGNLDGETADRVFGMVGKFSGGKGKGKRRGKVKVKPETKRNVKAKRKERTNKGNKKNKDIVGKRITKKKKAISKNQKTDKNGRNSKGNKKQSRDNKSKFDISAIESKFDEFNDLVEAIAPQEDEDEETDARQTDTVDDSSSTDVTNDSSDVDAEADLAIQRSRERGQEISAIAREHRLPASDFNFGRVQVRAATRSDRLSRLPESRVNTGQNIFGYANERQSNSPPPAPANFMQRRAEVTSGTAVSSINARSLGGSKQVDTDKTSNGSRLQMRVGVIDKLKNAEKDC